MTRINRVIKKKMSISKSVIGVRRITIVLRLRSFYLDKSLKKVRFFFFFLFLLRSGCIKKHTLCFLRINYFQKRKKRFLWIKSRMNLILTILNLKVTRLPRKTYYRNMKSKPLHEKTATL